MAIALDPALLYCSFISSMRLRGPREGCSGIISGLELLIPRLDDVAYRRLFPLVR